MKPIKHLLCAAIIACSYPAAAYAQDQLSKDLDGDGKADRVWIDREQLMLYCTLSTRQYKPVHSKVIETMNETSGLKATKNGFEFSNNWMRAGYANQFRYNGKTGQVMLIGMSRYELGNAANDGAGESSVNLLTGDYIGNWSYYDDQKQKLVSIPEIRTKMILPRTSLEQFGENTYAEYSDKCTTLYELGKEKTKRIKQ